MGFPQLRIRSGYSYKKAYGRWPEIIAQLKAVEADFAAVVDQGTWGAVRYEQAMEKAEIQHGFGMEVPLARFDDEGELTQYKPTAWILAKDTKQFFRSTSAIVQAQVFTCDDFEELEGVIKFAGGAIYDLQDHQFDYIDVNPSSIVAAAHAVERHRKSGKPMVITSYNDMPSRDHRDFAYSWEVRDSVGHRYIAGEAELWDELKVVMSRAEFDAAVRNTHAVADSIRGLRLAKAPLIHLDGDLVALAREGQKYRLERGHIKEWTDVYEERFLEEIKQIQAKKFDSYFLVVADLVAFAKKHMLVGPARGSSAGSLVCYLTGITEVDPLPHKLLFQRFIDISRSDLPDIDIDFADTHRYMVFDYLQEKYGRWNVVKLGNINTLKAASVIAQVGKKFGIPFHDTDSIKNSLMEYTSADERYGKALADTFANTQPGKEFVVNHPEAAACMGDIEIHPSHSGVHAAGILVCNDEVIDYCTVGFDGVAQLDKPDSEYLNLLKIDALGLRTLGVIQDAGVISSQELYDLPLDDKAVLDVLNENRMSGIFQFEGQAVRSVANLVDITSFENIDHITALARPGPLSSGMAVKYIERVAGREPVTFEVPQVEKYLSGTYGVFLYQEQIMSIVKDIGLFDWEQTSAIRKAMSARKGEEFFNKRRELFVKGATTSGLDEVSATRIWNDMVTFGAWGFNRSHSVSYAVVTYWTCYLKRYFKLEFAAACLRAAKDDVQTISILRELAKEGVEYQAIDPEHSELNWKAVNGMIVGGIMNAKGYGPVKAARYIALRAARGDSDKAMKAYQAAAERLAASQVQYSDLAEAHSRFGEYYADPRKIGVTSGNPIINMNEVKDGDDGLMIVKLVKKVLSDENEPIRQKRRKDEGKREVYKGQSQFLDLMCIDDSVDQPMRMRIRPEKFLAVGKPIAEGTPNGSWFLVKGWKLSGTPMFIIKAIKRIDE